MNLIKEEVLEQLAKRGWLPQEDDPDFDRAVKINDTIYTIYRTSFGNKDCRHYIILEGKPFNFSRWESKEYRDGNIWVAEDDEIIDVGIYPPSYERHTGQNHKVKERQGNFADLWNLLVEKGADAVHEYKKKLEREFKNERKKMSNENIIKDTVLRKVEEVNSKIAEERAKSPYTFIEHNNERVSYADETRIRNGREFGIRYQIIDSADNYQFPRTLHYQISLEEFSPNEHWKQVEDFLYAYWKQVEDNRGNLLSLKFGMRKWRCLRTENGYTFEKQTIFDLKGKSIEDIMLPVVRKACDIGSFVDTWNNLIASRTHKNYGALYARAEQLFEKAIRAHEIVGARKKDPEWQAICRDAQQLRTTEAGKAKARQMIQAYLRREKQNFKQ